MADVEEPLTRQDKIEMVASAAGVEGNRAIYALEKNGSPATYRIPCRKTISKSAPMAPELTCLLVISIAYQKP